MNKITPQAGRFKDKRLPERLLKLLNQGEHIAVIGSVGCGATKLFNDVVEQSRKGRGPAHDRPMSDAYSASDLRAFSFSPSRPLGVSNKQGMAGVMPPNQPEVVYHCPVNERLERVQPTSFENKILLLDDAMVGMQTGLAPLNLRGAHGLAVFLNTNHIKYVQASWNAILPGVRRSLNLELLSNGYAKFHQRILHSEIPPNLQRRASVLSNRGGA